MIMECSGFAVGSTTFWIIVHIVAFIVIGISSINDDKE